MRGSGKVFVGRVDLGTVMRELVRVDESGYVTMYAVEIPVKELINELGSDFTCVGGSGVEWAVRLGLSCGSVAATASPWDVIYGLYDGGSGYRASVQAPVVAPRGPAQWFVQLSING